VMQFEKATKRKAKLRLALFGTSGSGKTYTGLRMATGLGGPIALIDTERGSASKYADRFEFDVLELPARDIGTYCQAIEAAQSAGYRVLIIDSLTHAWQELLQEIDKLARAKFGGNTWSAWSEGTPKQQRLVDAILGYDGHVIATMRVKTEWTLSHNDRGKLEPKRVGLAPQQGKGIEYEFDMLMQLDSDHTARVLKDRTGRYQDAIIELPGEDLGQELAAWLESEELPEAKTGETIDEEAKSQATATRTRPYDPDCLRDKLAAKLAGDKTLVAERSLQGAVCGALDNLFMFRNDDKVHATEKRHSLLTFFFASDTTKTLTQAQASAMLNWAQDQNEDGEYVPNSHAVEEAARVVRQVLAEAGQADMFGKDAEEKTVTPEGPEAQA